MTSQEVDILVKKRLNAFPHGNNTRNIENFRYTCERSLAYFYYPEFSPSPDLFLMNQWLEKHLHSAISKLKTEPDVDTLYFRGRPNIKVSEWNETVKIGQLVVSKTIKVKYNSLLLPINSEFHFLLQI